MIIDDFNYRREMAYKQNKAQSAMSSTKASSVHQQISPPGSPNSSRKALNFKSRS
jgi:hypothetical protein